MPRRPVHDRGETRAQSAARALICDEVLPRLLRTVADMELEATSVLAAIRRRIDAARRADGDTSDTVATLSFVRQMIEVAVSYERTRRMSELGTDGTP
jgi:hypothetical protein